MNFGSGAGGGGRGAVNEGADLQEIETEHLLFNAVSGEEKLRLLPSPWPADNLPTTTSSLLSVAHTKGLLAAAGPDTLVLASTDSLRQSFTTAQADGNKIKSFSPQATISVPRLSQVAFTSDESCLVISAEQGGGLAVYDSATLTNGGKDAAFQLATEGQSVRQLLPNPNPSQDTSRFCGIVTSSGQLLLADLKDRKLVSTAGGSAVFQQNVSCACWSRLGKQIIAGLADGTAAQIDQQGNVKGTIPEPPQLPGLKQPQAVSYPITSIYWLETFDFLIVHTPIFPPGTHDDVNHDSIYHLAHKDKASGSWTFSKLPDPCPPFGMEQRRPGNHFIQRLRDWPPSLTDTLILASTASSDVSLFTRSQRPLNEETPVADAWTLTLPPEGRRPLLPFGANGDTSPIGIAMDLSAKENVPRPIPTDEELEKSPSPLPGLYVLNQEGILSMWWMVYTDSIRQQTSFPDLVAVGGPRPLQEKAGASSSAATSAPSAGSSTFGSFGGASSAAPVKPAFGQSTFGSASPVAGSNPPASATKPAFGQSSFGSPSPMAASNAPAFGKPSTPTFGGASSIGNQSPWVKAAAPSAFGSGSKPAFGQSTFGQSSALGGGSGFGQAGALGQSKSPWGGASQQTAQSPQAASGGGVFGGNTSGASPFMSMGGKTGDSGAPASGFSAFAKKENQPSPFGAKPSLSAEPSGSTVSFGTGSSFGSGTSLFGGQQTPSAFGTPAQNGTSTFGKPSFGQASKEEAMEEDAPAKPAENTSKSPFGMPSGGFKLGSTFQGDGSAKDDLPKPKNAGAGFFGSTFGNALGAAAQETPAVKKEPGIEEGPSLQDIPEAKSPSTTPKAAPKEQFSSDEAPLPPDPTTWKPKEGAPPPPIPPGFGDDFIKPKPKGEEGAQNAPLPPDFTKNTSNESEKPVAGSPPIDLGSEKFSEGVGSGEEGPPEDDDEVDWSEEDDEEGEEEEEEEAEEEEEETAIEDPKGLAAFQSRITPASPKLPPKSPEAQQSTTPATEKKKSYTPAGLPKAPVMFPPPSKAVQDSPRSPSPVRNATSPQRLMAQPFNSSRPKPPPSPAAGLSKSRQTSQGSGISKGPPQRIAVPPAQLMAQDQQRETASAQPEEPTAGQLEDEEDARVQDILAAPVEGTRDVPSFLAHQDYVGSGQAARDAATSKSGLGGQIERVFRDINSMIDTLALNARGMQAFIQGNEATRGVVKDRGDLEDAEGWALGDADQLLGVMEALDEDLQEEQLEDVRGILEDIHDESNETNRLRMRVAELRKHVNAHADPARAREQQLAPLPMESLSQQSEIRQGVQKVQTLLAKAEEQVSLLRAELASHQQASKQSSQATPTVEAVTNTITKMTAMIEKRSGDVDVLESAIRRLGGLPPASKAGLADGYEDDLAGAMKASRLSYGSPAPTPGSVSARRLVMRQSRFGGSSIGTPGGGGSARKQSLMQPDDEAVEAYRARKEARRKVCGVLRDEVLAGRSVKVTRVRDG